MSERRYLSIGEVLGLLLEEFPDITISKIRFLESQGLIDPERTPSGYRKFYDADVERLRLILREQRENYLPLKVIKDRLDNGELIGEDATPTGTLRLPRPRGAAWFEPVAPPAAPRRDHSDVTGAAPSPAGAFPPAAAVAPPVPAAPPAAVPDGGATDDELCALAGVERSFLAELESFGLITSRPLGALRVYDVSAVDVVVAAAGLCERGLEPRHLRVWRTAVDREMDLIEQLVLPLMRQRNPKAREQAAGMAHDIEQLGSDLRAALARGALRHLIG